jgi:HEPN domain-containing protein
MKPVVQEWLDFAKTDLKAAELLVSDPTLTAPASFHSQQCAEKCLKAVAESMGSNPPKTHDLIRIYGIIEGVISINEDMLAKLNEIYIDVRYPAGMGLLPDGVPTVEEAKGFVKFAKSLYQLVLNSLSK